MKLSVLYEERWLPPDVEKFAQKVYQETVDNPGEHIYRTFKRLEGSHEFLIHVNVLYKDAKRENVNGNFCYHRPPHMKIDILINRPPGDRYLPFADFRNSLLKREIYTTLVHELTHALDPKVINKELLNKKWGAENPDVGEKMNVDVKNWKAAGFPFQPAPDYYLTRPWEIDASFNAHAASYFIMGKNRGQTTDEILDGIKTLHPATSSEKAFKKRGLWNKYLSYLYRYIKYKSEGATA
jgi:hypothetical protein